MLEALKEYDVAPNSGRAPAHAEAILEFAPGVCCVVDWFEDQLEYDIYFDEGIVTPKFPSECQTTSMPGLCVIGLGSFPRDVAQVFTYAKLHLHGVHWDFTWRAEPLLMSTSKEPT